MFRRFSALFVVFLLVFSIGFVAGAQTTDPVSELEAAQADLALGFNDLIEASEALIQARGNFESAAAHVSNAKTALEAQTTTTTTAPETTTTTEATTTTAAPTTTTTAAPTTTTTTAPPTTTTTAPPACVGVDVAAGSNLVTVANSEPAGTTFCLAAGTFDVTASIPFQTNDQWIGALGPNGERLSILDGGGTTDYLVTATSDHVLLQNVIIENFNNALQQGVNTGAQTFWTWDNVEVRENNAFGIHLHNDSKVINSYIHHNHQMGLGGNGDRILVENTEVAFNNYLGENTPGWEAGGSKWVNSVDAVIRGNYFHHNCGAGIWFDGSGNRNQLIEDNVSEDNWSAGIFYEMSTGPAIIRNNIVNRNAFGAAGPICAGTPGGNSSNAGNGGIRVNDSRDVEVYGNVLADNDGGIGAGDSDRGSSDPDLINLLVHDNEVTWSVGFTGIVDTDPGHNPFSSNNRFENNTYHGGSFAWDGDLSITFAEWQSFGHDDTGTYD